VFWQTPSVLWVLGGVALTSLAAFPGGGWRTLRALLRNALWVRHRQPQELVAMLVSFAHTARRHGLLALERPAASLEDAYVRRPLRMAIDGNDPGIIAKIMRAELEAVDLRHTHGVRMLESAARSAPVFGMMGTLVGLVLMLGRMNDPASIGPGMAVALLTTLYGLLLAHVFCLPVARRLAHRNSEELLLRTVALEGVLAIQAGDNPRLIEQRLWAYLPADMRTPIAESLVGSSTSEDRDGVASGTAGGQSLRSNEGPAIAAEPREKDDVRKDDAGGRHEPAHALTDEALEQLLAARRRRMARNRDEQATESPTARRSPSSRAAV
jgi:chemotaxis protein MotA